MGKLQRAAAKQRTLCRPELLRAKVETFVRHHLAKSAPELNIWVEEVPPHPVSLPSPGSGFSFFDLPDDLVAVIFSFMTISDYCALAQTCRRMRDLCDTLYVWHQWLELCTPDLSKAITVTFGTSHLAYCRKLAVGFVCLQTREPKKFRANQANALGKFMKSIRAVALSALFMLSLLVHLLSFHSGFRPLLSHLLAFASVLQLCYIRSCDKYPPREQYSSFLRVTLLVMSLQLIDKPFDGVALDALRLVTLLYTCGLLLDMRLLSRLPKGYPFWEFYRKRELVHVKYFGAALVCTFAHFLLAVNPTLWHFSAALPIAAVVLVLLNRSAKGYEHVLAAIPFVLETASYVLTRFIDRNMGMVPLLLLLVLCVAQVCDILRKQWSRMRRRQYKWDRLKLIRVRPRFTTITWAQS